MSVQPGLVAFSGSIGSASLHAHAAVQVYLCDRGEVRIGDEDGHATWATSVVIPAGAKHTVTPAPDTSGTTVFVDPSSIWAPNTAEGAGLADWIDPRVAEAVREAVATAATAARSTTATFGARVEHWVRSRLPDPVLVTDLADSMAVSEATLRRRAKAELGLGVQTYVRWVRLIVALEHIALGATITDAATAAGFTDGPHATRACREMFGLAPSDAIAHLMLNNT